VGFVSEVVLELALLIAGRFGAGAQRELVVAERVLLVVFESGKQGAPPPVARFVLIVFGAGSFDRSSEDETRHGHP
jgi:hypothetical protein